MACSNCGAEGWHACIGPVGGLAITLHDNDEIQVLKDGVYDLPSGGQYTVKDGAIVSAYSGGFGADDSAHFASSGGASVGVIDGVAGIGMASSAAHYSSGSGMAYANSGGIQGGSGGISVSQEPRGGGGPLHRERREVSISEAFYHQLILSYGIALEIKALIDAGDNDGILAKITKLVERLNEKS